MAFPSNPDNGDTYTNENGTKYIYDSTDNKWIIAADIKLVDDTAHSDDWDGVTGRAPSVNAVYDALKKILPAGTILPFGGTSAPAGYLLCDGSAISRTTYADLFTAIGEAFGEGDGSSTFNIPDLEGRFLRGVDNGSGRDADASSRTASATGGNTGDNVGSLQGDAIVDITGQWYVPNLSANSWSASGAFSAVSISVNVEADNSAEGGEYNGCNFAASNVVDVGSDVRPMNIAVNYIIKY